MVDVTTQIKSSRKLSEQVRRFLQASLSDNTRRAYSNDLAQFINWGGKIPATPECVASYVAIHAGELSVSTLTRRVVAIGKAHTSRCLPSPTQSELVRATLRGVRRTYNGAQRRVKPALSQQIRAMVDGLHGMVGVRDRALLLVGFAGAFRRSELVSIRVEDIRLVAEGIIIHLRQGKTDQMGKGRDIAIPFIRGRYCPVKAMLNWLSASTIRKGKLFRRVDRYGNVSGDGLSPQSVALIVKRRAEDIGLDSQDYSGHSLRAGLITSAAKAGASAWKICQQSGHQSEAMLQRYIRDGNLFSDHPLRKVW